MFVTLYDSEKDRWYIGIGNTQGVYKWSDCVVVCFDALHYCRCLKGEKHGG
jgi:hypothetical protein